MNTSGADVAREAHLVRDHHQRHALGGQLLDHLQHLVDQLRVERRGDLVAQQHRGLHGQRAGDGHALLLAAGELARVGVELVGQADRCQQLRAPAPRARPACPC